MRSKGSTKTDQIEWPERIPAVQPRIRLVRSFDQRRHSHLGYVLRVQGTMEDEPFLDPPFHGVPPDLETFRNRGHRRLGARTYDAKCTTCDTLTAFFATSSCYRSSDIRTSRMQTDAEENPSGSVFRSVSKQRLLEIPDSLDGGPIVKKAR